VIDPLVATLVAKAGIVAVGAVFVRSQLAIHRGFDLSLAAIALAGGELFVAAASLTHGAGARLAGAILAGLAGAALGCLWGRILARRLESLAGAQARVLIASLGLATLASGAVGALRGPGMAQLAEAPAWGPLPGNFGTAFLLVAVGAGAMVLWTNSRAGFQASLLDQDRSFALELGCDGRSVAMIGGALCGVGGAMAGAANATLVGTAPSSGMTLFLMSAAGALLLGREGFRGAAFGGVAIAAIHTAITMWIEPVWADFAVFGGLALILVVRGWDRTADAVR
jgi:branched-subunit amino acid ABC-type transport system permease component